MSFASTASYANMGHSSANGLSSYSMDMISTGGGIFPITIDEVQLSTLINLYCQLFHQSFNLDHTVNKYSPFLLEETAARYVATKGGDCNIKTSQIRILLESVLAFYDYAKEWENGRIKGSNGTSLYLLSDDDRNELIRDKKYLTCISEQLYNLLDSTINKSNEIKANISISSDPFSAQFKFPDTNHGFDSAKESHGDTIADIAQQLITLRFNSDDIDDSSVDGEDELSLFMNEIAPSIYTRYYKQGDILCQEGEQAKAMFFILKGTVQVTSSDGEIVYAELEPVSYFGEIGILYDMNRTATVSAKTKCTVAVLKAADFKGVLEKYSAIKSQLIKEAENRLSQLRDRNMSITGKRPLNTIDSSYKARAADGYDSSRQSDNSSPISVIKENYDSLRLAVPPSGTSQPIPRSPSFSTLIPHSSPSILGDYPDELGRSLNTNYFPLLSTRSPSMESCNKSSKSKSASSFNLTQQDIATIDDDLTSDDYGIDGSLVETIDLIDSTKSDNNDLKYENVNISETLPYTPLPVSNDMVMSPRSQQLISQYTGRRRGSVAPWAEGIVLPPSSIPKVQLSPKRPEINDGYSSSPSVSLDSMEAAEDLEDKEIRGIFNKSIMQKIAAYSDFKTIVKLSWMNKFYEGLFKDYNPTRLDLTTINKSVKNNVLEEILGKHGKNVQHLYLTNCWELSNDATPIINKFGQKLRTLSLSNSWNLSDSGLELLSLPLCKRISLTNLRKIRSPGVLSLLSNSNINTITLSYCKSVGNDALIHPAWADIKYADFSRCTGISDEGFLAWTTFVNSNESREVDIDEDAMVIDNTIPASLSTGQFFSMKALFLNDCSFLTSQVLDRIFPIMPNLETLSLSFCCALTYLPKPPKKLRNLDLSFCPIATDELLSKLEGLDIIGLRGCVCVTGDGLWSMRNKGYKAIGYSGTAVEQVRIIERSNINDKKFPWEVLKSNNVFDHLQIKI